MKIYTRTGDKGITSLYGGKRIRKDQLRIAAYGTIDELNSVLGILISQLERKEEVRSFLLKIQHDLFYIGSYLAEGKVNLEKVGTRVIEMEKYIDKLDNQLPPLKNFILPSGTKTATLAHFVRAVIRRAERKVVGLLDDKEEIDERVLRYLNRLSDLVFVIARYLNKLAGEKEMIWKSSDK